MKNDIQLQHDVVTELGREQEIIAGTIGVEVHHGVVKLAGRLGDVALMNKTEVAVRRVDGVTTVLMDIDVTGAATKPQSTLDVARIAPRT